MNSWNVTSIVHTSYIPLFSCGHRFRRNEDKLNIKASALIWWISNSLLLLVLLGLYWGGFSLPHWDKTRLVAEDLFVPLSGVVLLMGPIHYMLLHQQVNTREQFQIFLPNSI